MSSVDTQNFYDLLKKCGVDATLFPYTIIRQLMKWFLKLVPLQNLAIYTKICLIAFENSYRFTKLNKVLQENLTLARMSRFWSKS